MALQVLLVILTSVSLVCGQLGSLTGPVRRYPAITGAQERALELFQNPELRALAASSNERVFIEIDGPQSTAIVEEGVNTNMDCFPWLSRFPGGTVQWLMRQRDENGQITGEAEMVNPTAEEDLLTTATVVGGEFLRWFNITGTLIVRGAEDPSFGDYICMVCIARGTPFEQCHSATLTLHIIGAPPTLIKAINNEPEVRLGVLIYNIGADFCLDFSENQTITIRCLILEGVNVSQVVPTATRTWVKDGLVIYSGLGSVPFNETFLMTGDNALFTPGAVIPTPLDIVMLSSSGSIQLNTVAGNLSMSMLAPDDVNDDNVRRRVFENLLGDYMCSVGNVFGTDSAMTNIRECGTAPVVPRCEVETLFLEGNELVPAGCNVCIPTGSAVFLTCLATDGSMPLVYMWVGPASFSSMDATIRVSNEGQYNCTVSNQDNPRGVMLTTDVFITPMSLLTTTLTNQFGDQSSGNGCGRLRRPLNSEPDMCLFLGELFDLSCTADEMSLNVTYQNGSVFEGPITVVQALDRMTFQCLTETNTPCDAAANNHTVRVFDPARINRNLDLAVGEIGAGQTTDTQTVNEGGIVTLVCPANGIDDPQTTWNLITTSASGAVEEIPINETGDPDYSVSMRDDSLVLTITGYAGERHNGIYGCRTENIAGQDTAIVALSSTPDTGIWMATNYTDCNVNCNEGVRVRSVTCRSIRDGRLLPNDECSDPRPPSQRDCSDIFPNDCFLTPIFVTGKYGRCSQGCEGGFRERSVTCTVPMTGEVLDDFACFPLRKPRKTENCQNTCCVDDTYSTCRRIGSRFCNLNLYQQKCCWTCLLRVQPY